MMGVMISLVELFGKVKVGAGSILNPPLPINVIY